MIRAQYGRGNVVCPACGKKTAHDGRGMTFSIGTTEASITVSRCSKCGAEFVDDTKIVRSGHRREVTPEMWANRLAAIDKQRGYEQRMIACHVGALRELDAARSALLASGLLPKDCAATDTDSQPPPGGEPMRDP